MEHHIAAFVESVSNRAQDIDPDNERDWYDLAYGFFLGRGLPPDLAQELASRVNE